MTNTSGHQFSRRVAVFGGGPAGLTAAHELAERGFQVDLYERLGVLGGKCRTYGVPNTGTDGRKDLPGEIGAHFVLSWYQNLGETMQRIPTSAGRSVMDNWTTGQAGVAGRVICGSADLQFPIPSIDNIRAGAFSPRVLLKMTTGLVKTMGNFTPYDAAHIASKLLALFTSGPQRQWGQLEHQTFNEFMRTDRLSANGKLVEFMPTFSGTSRGDRMNARVMGRIMQEFYSGGLKRRYGPGLRRYVSATDGPLNEMWIDPWARHVQNLGARIHTGQAVSRLSYDGGRLTGATVVDADGTESRVEADYYVLAVPFERAATLLTDEMVAADPALGRVKDLEGIWTSGLMLYLTEPLPELSVASMSFGPKRRSGVDEPFWELAPINWTRTWSWGDDFDQHYGDGMAVTYLPIEVGSSSWTDFPGKLYGKPMRECTEDEIQAEVLDLLRRTYPDGHRIFADSRIHSFRLTDGIRRQGDRWVNDNAVCFAPSPGCWENQPEVQTNIPNLFLAGGHVRSTTGWDNMDAANQTGKQAAAAIIAAAGVNAPAIPVAEWSTPLELKPFMAVDDLLYRMGRPNAFDIVAPSRPKRGSIVTAETRNETAPSWTEWVAGATESGTQAARTEEAI